MRKYATPNVGRIEDDKFILDVTTVQDDELQMIQNAFEKLLRGPDHVD